MDSPMVDFVLEFFLPVDCTNRDDQKKVIKSLLVIVQNICGSLRIVTEMESEDEGVNEGVANVQETDYQGSRSGLGSGMEKRRSGAKMEKTNALEMLRQHFAGSLKDAAKNMGGKCSCFCNGSKLKMEMGLRGARVCVRETRARLVINKISFTQKWSMRMVKSLKEKKMQEMFRVCLARIVTCGIYQVMIS